LIDVLGAQLEVKFGLHWKLDDAIFALLRNRELIVAMLTKVIGAPAAASHLTETGTQKKARTGYGRTKVAA
jgi:hypothetical protein